MIIQNKPDYLIFADSAKKGENAEFPDVSRGWGVTIDQTASKPPMEWMNGAFNRIDKNMLYLLQQGVPEWSEQVTYPANAIIKYNGVLYTAIVENDNAIPTTSTTKWKKTQEEIPNASLFQKGVVKLNSEINSESETEAATPKAIKKVCDLANNQVPNIRKINNKTLNTDIVLQADDVNALPAIRKFDNNIPIYEVGKQVDFQKIMINGQPIGRFIIASGYNANGWYEIYNDGFKRVGKLWTSTEPLQAPGDGGTGVVVTFPISFNINIISVQVSVETTTNHIETINYQLVSLYEIRLAAAFVTYRGITPTNYLPCSYVVEGY